MGKEEMTDHQLGYKAFFDDVPCLNNKSQEWIDGWRTAAHDLEVSQRHHYDQEVTEFGYGE